jgi:hypothetical protein
LINSENLQKTVARWENPVVTAHEISKHVNDLNEKVKKIMSKPVPAPPKVEKKPE